MLKFLFLLWLGVTLLPAGIIKSNAAIDKVVKASFSNVTAIEPRQLILTKTLFKKVQAKAKAPIRTKIYRYYRVKSGAKTIGYGVLMVRTLRTKKATVLYAFDNKGKLKFSEIMAFGEPPEFVPNKQWMQLFQDKPNSAKLTMGKDIPTISGATLSARTITEGARVARAIYNEILRK